MTMTYKIVRCFADRNKHNVVLKTGLTLEQAQAQLQRPGDLEHHGHESRSRSTNARSRRLVRRVLPGRVVSNRLQTAIKTLRAVLEVPEPAPAKRSIGAPRTVTDEQRALVLRLRADRHTHRGIAKATGIPVSTVGNILKEAGK